MCSSLKHGLQMWQEPQTSAGCKELIRRMLVSNPEQRISLADIKQHPFFYEGLPEGAIKMNDSLLQNRPFHDPQVTLQTSTSPHFKAPTMRL